VIYQRCGRSSKVSLTRYRREDVFDGKGNFATAERRTHVYCKIASSSSSVPSRIVANKFTAPNCLSRKQVRDRELLSWRKRGRRKRENAANMRCGAHVLFWSCTPSTAPWIPITISGLILPIKLVIYRLRLDYSDCSILNVTCEVMPDSIPTENAVKSPRTLGTGAVKRLLLVG
jgi:hypothetical protein